MSNSETIASLAAVLQLHQFLLSPPYHLIHTRGRRRLREEFTPGTRRMTSPIHPGECNLTDPALEHVRPEAASDESEAQFKKIVYGLLFYRPY